jgi:hypothetical protein
VAVTNGAESRPGKLWLTVQRLSCSRSFEVDSSRLQPKNYHYNAASTFKLARLYTRKIIVLRLLIITIEIGWHLQVNLQQVDSSSVAVDLASPVGIGMHKPAGMHVNRATRQVVLLVY